jgi:hypothetical protein
VRPQVVKHYVPTSTPPRASALFGDDPDGVDPADLVGRWEMEINETLRILETHAPDNGGPVLEIVERRAAQLVLKGARMLRRDRPPCPRDPRVARARARQRAVPRDGGPPRRRALALRPHRSRWQAALETASAATGACLAGVGSRNAANRVRSRPPRSPVGVARAPVPCTHAALRDRVRACRQGWDRSRHKEHDCAAGRETRRSVRALPPSGNHRREWRAGVVEPSITGSNSSLTSRG